MVHTRTGVLGKIYMYHTDELKMTLSRHCRLLHIAPFPPLECTCTYMYMYSQHIPVSIGCSLGPREHDIIQPSSLKEINQVSTYMYIHVPSLTDRRWGAMGVNRPLNS